MLRKFYWTHQDACDGLIALAVVCVGVAGVLTAAWQFGRLAAAHHLDVEEWLMAGSIGWIVGRFGWLR